MLDEKDIQELLRLKRDEQPGEEYFAGFLREFHRRQRAEMLRQPAWRVALERLQALFSEHSYGRLAYSGAAAVVLAVAAVVSMNILDQSGTLPAQGGIAAGRVSAPADSGIRIPDVAPASVVAAQPYHMASSRLHYVMDVRPASYELPSSF
jgi:hypothetical protein